MDWQFTCTWISDRTAHIKSPPLYCIIHGMASWPGRTGWPAELTATLNSGCNKSLHTLTARLLSWAALRRRRRHQQHQATTTTTTNTTTFATMTNNNTLIKLNTSRRKRVYRVLITRAFPPPAVSRFPILFSHCGLCTVWLPTIYMYLYGCISRYNFVVIDRPRTCFFLNILTAIIHILKHVCVCLLRIHGVTFSYSSDSTAVVSVYMRNCAGARRWMNEILRNIYICISVDILKPRPCDAKSHVYSQWQRVVVSECESEERIFLRKTTCCTTRVGVRANRSNNYLFISAMYTYLIVHNKSLSDLYIWHLINVFVLITHTYIQQARQRKDFVILFKRSV